MAGRNSRKRVVARGKRVMVYIVRAKRRAFIMPHDLKGARGRYDTDDREAMGEEEWERERIRRLRSLFFLTPDERGVLKHYWELRDDE